MYVTRCHVFNLCVCVRVCVSLCVCACVFHTGILVEAYSPLLTLSRKPGGPVDPVVEAIAKEINATPGRGAVLGHSQRTGLCTCLYRLRVRAYVCVCVCVRARARV